MDPAGIIIITLIGAATFIYACIMAAFRAGWSRLKSSEEKSSVHSSRISILIPARNERLNIISILNDLAEQDYPCSLTEVLVIDDHSDDKTAESAAQFIKDRGLDHMKVLACRPEHIAGKKPALGRGIEAATGELIITTDADCRVGTGWLSAFARHYERGNNVLIAGLVAYHDSKGFLNHFQTLEFLGLVASGAGAAGTGHPFMCNGASLAFERQAFFDTGGYEGNERFASGDDVFLLHRMKKKFGSKAIGFLKDRNAIVYTKPAASWHHFFSQRIRWASKSTGYRDAFALFVAMLVFLVPVAIITGFIYACFDGAFLWYSLAALGIKTFVDFLLLYMITKFVGRRKLLILLPVFELIYLPYVFISGIMGFVGFGRWKGRGSLKQ